MMHPTRGEKLAGKVINSFEVDLHIHGSSCVHVVRADGWKVQFSYRRCLGLK